MENDRTAKETAEGGCGEKKAAGKSENAEEKKETATVPVEDYKRLAADFDNYRKFAEKGLAEAKSTGAAALAGEILPVLDDLDSAIGHCKQNPEVCGGIEGIRKKLFESLEKIGLEEMPDCTGCKFDHEVMEAVKTDGNAEEGVVAAQLRKGYACGGEIIRHPLVVVGSKKTGGTEKEE